jgi:hypothetical protein
MDEIFTAADSWVIALGLAVAMLLGWWTGWLIGRKRPIDSDDKMTERFCDGAMALLGLLLGFSFAMALGNYGQRRSTVIADSNSIGDFYSCVSMLKDPLRSQLQDVVRQYVDTRLAMGHDNADDASIEKSIGQSEQLQRRMIDLTAEAVIAGTPIAVPLVQSLDSLKSSDGSLQAAMEDRLPGEVVVLMCAAAIVSTVLVGRQHSTPKKMHVSGTLGYVFLVALAVYVVFDLNEPTKGLIQVDSGPFQRLASAIGK